MEQNRESRNKSKHIWSTNFQQGYQKDTMEKGLNDVEKQDFHRQKERKEREKR
jgi:hypothetical protein